MKTIKKKGQTPRRLPDGAAQEMIMKEGWAYCPKGWWKEKVRDAKPIETKKKATKKKQKNLKKLFGTVSNRCDAKYVENPKATAFRDKVLGKRNERK